MRDPRLLRGLRTLLLAMLAVMLCFGGCGGGSGGGAVEGLVEPGYVLPPEYIHYGASYAEWSAKWWQWALEGPFTVSPMADQTGEYAWQNQVDPVWYIAGSWGDINHPGPSVTSRNVTMPSGKALFFPIVNVEWDYTFCIEPNTPPKSITQLRQEAYNVMQGCRDLYCVVDGITIFDSPDTAGCARFRVISPEFQVLMPSDPCGVLPSPFVMDPTVSDGVFVMLAPLPAGEHRVRFGTHHVDGWGFDVFYTITVLP